MPGQTILVVDDSPTERRIMSAPLNGQGYQIHTATDGEEALSKVADIRPDLILLDIILPKKNGYQVCRQLKSAPATKDIKIVLVSSKNQESDRFWGMKQGADDYLFKPFSDRELLDCVAKYV